LRPDAATNNAFLYCLIDAALRCEIDVLLPCAMSNHYHAVIYDRAGRYPEFIEHFHKLLARSQNALRGRWENLWSSEQTCVVRLVDREAVIDKLVYTATNPVQDHLVARHRRRRAADLLARSSPHHARLQYWCKYVSGQANQIVRVGAARFLSPFLPVAWTVAKTPRIVCSAGRDHGRMSILIPLRSRPGGESVYGNAT